MRHPCRSFLPLCSRQRPFPCPYPRTHLLTTALLTLLLATAACTARIPEPISHPYSQQEKMQASGHWDILAQDLANRINNQLIRTNHLHSPIFVEQTCGDEKKNCSPEETSPFNEAFRDLLITSLVDHGIPTRHQPDDQAIEVLYKVQVVRHHGERIRTLQPGLLTALAAGIVVLRNAPADIVLLAAGTAADVANSSLNRHGHYEVIITTSMLADDNYLFRASDIYYINDRDFWHYEENRLTPKTIRLTSAGHSAKGGTSAPVAKKPAGEVATAPVDGQAL